MKHFFFLAFIGVLFLTRDVTPSTLRKHPTNLESLFGSAVKSNETEKEDSPNVCKTQECEKIAKIIADSMDKSANPCNDFYEYACGKWSEHNPIPEGYSSWGMFYMIQEKVENQIQAILDTGPQSDDVLAVKLAKKWYSVCTDTDEMEKQGVEPIVYTLARIGGWPMIMDPDEWDEEEYNWQKVDDQYMRLTGRNAFHDVRVHTSYRETESGSTESSVTNSTKATRIDTPHLPLGTYMLWIDEMDSDEIFDDPSDEDTSDENKQSDEEYNEEPGSEGSEEDDDDEDDEYYDDEYYDDKDDDDENDDEEDDDEEAKKENNKKKTYGRISRKKTKKVEHVEKKKSSSRVSTKQDRQEPGSEGSENDEDDDYEDDDDDDEDDEDDDDEDDDEEDDDEEAKKANNKNKKKIYGRISQKKNKKVKHSEKRKTGRVSTKQGRQEPGSEGNEENFNDDDNNDVKDNADAKKRIRTKTKRIARKKNRKSESSGKNKHDVRLSTKHGNHKTKQRLKRQADMKRIFNKLARSNHHVLRARQNKRNRMNEKRMERTKETSGEQTKVTTSAPQVSSSTTEETSEEIDLEVRKQYATYVSKVARVLAKARRTGVPEDHIDKDIEDMIDFQIKLAELTMAFGEDIEITLDDLQNWYDEKNPKPDHSKINWVYKITQLFDEASVPVDGDLEIELGSPDYFEGLISLLDKTPSRVIVNYIHWNFVSEAIRTTTKEMRDLYNTWMGEEAEDIEKEKKRRASYCKWEVQMTDILAYEYVRRHFSDNIAQTAQDMVDDIQKEVEYQIKQSDWMDDNTKDFVLAKLVNMKKYIGYPDWYKNDTIVKRYYQGLILCNSYYENILSYDRYNKRKDLRDLIPKEDGYEIWWMSPLTVNAFFDPEENSISISAADFQSPFFAYSRPQAINYGIIGVIMSHEVNHGFDDSGHLYNKKGEFVEWLSAMADAYGKRAECFVKQFNNYEIDKEGTKIEDYGNQTAGENIADTMGLEASYRAYLRRKRECGKPDTLLPGLEDITNDQLFFLSFANVWCEKDEDIGVTARFDSHSTGQLRTIGTVSNSEDFAKAFNCPVGSPMNPVKKCNIWK